MKKLTTVVLCVLLILGSFSAESFADDANDDFKLLETAEDRSAETGSSEEVSSEELFFQEGPSEEVTSEKESPDKELAIMADDSLTPENGIPLVIIRVDESETTIDDMNNSYQHSVRCTSATAEIVLPENYSGGYPIEEGGRMVPDGEVALDYIRGRGNSTWENSAKKPYKIQFSSKQDLFGMGASKDWALLANSFDESFMRNRITNWLGSEMGLDFTPQQVPVDLILVGSESGIHRYGSYCLCETVKVEESRVNIPKLKKNDSENITGGYLMAVYSTQDMDEPESTKFTTKYGVPILNDTPEYDDTSGGLTDAQQAQCSYIRGFMQELEDLIMEPGEIDEARHNEIAARMDLTSLADYWLIQEISFNTDAFGTSSTYFYKERDGRLCFGPLWDFDFGWNNNGMWKESNCTFNNTGMIWIDELRDKDPRFVSLLKERWQLMSQKLLELTEAGGVIDSYKAEVSASAQKDNEIWNDGSKDYNAAVESLRTWIEARRNWADENVDDIGKVFFTVSYESGEEVVATERVRYGEHAVLDPDTAAPEGSVFKNWKEKETEKSLNKYTVRRDTVFVPVFVEKSEAVEPEALILYISEEETVDLSEEVFSLEYIAEADPYETTNPRITWTSSNEKAGIIDVSGKQVILKGEGDTTVTGTLYNGASASFVLHVTDVNGLGGTHDFEYQLSEDQKTITAKCRAKYCTPGYNAQGISVTLKAPSDLIYDGTPKNAALSGYPDTEVPQLEARPEIVYYKSADPKSGGDGNSTTDETALSGAPSDAGNYTARITWGGQTASVAFTIKPASIKGAKVTPKKASVTYTGKVLKPGVKSVRLADGTGLTARDYSVSYKNNRNAGTATITVTGKGNYTGTAKGSFKINKAKQKVKAVKPKNKATRTLAVGKSLTIKATASKEQGTAQFKKISGNKKITLTSSGKLTVKKGITKGKTYTIRYKVRIKGTRNYKATQYVTRIIKIKVKK